ncbi:hypothetical protein KO516_21420 [Citreicella sp. C3M06]|nr:MULTISPECIES: hypothetical protein [Roseobacteraceae]MBU2962748.1 hypothetical protein [Citreicella sp. C3M06]MBU2963336.1 hypothetical protein [Citreicella sp. C3M06]MDO6587705.1 hypothetical protein [Salipiger sp. 1_MG-2023]
MTAFSAAMLTLFANGDLAVDAIWTPVATGVPVDCRAVRRSPDQVAEFQGVRMHVSTDLFDVRQSQVPNPRPGDAFACGGDSFVIQSEPEADAERLIWTLDVRPA